MNLQHRRALGGILLKSLTGSGQNVSEGSFLVGAWSMIRVVGLLEATAADCTHRSFLQNLSKCPSLKHKRTKEGLWMESSGNAPWVKAELAAMTQGRAEAGDGSIIGELHGPPGQEYIGMTGLHRGQTVGHLSGGTSTSSATPKRGPREGVNKIMCSAGGDVRTMCKEGRLKEALHILDHPGFCADSNTYVCVLQSCINMKALAEGKQVHSHIIRSEFTPKISVVNTLVNMYMKCGSMGDARQVFEEMSARDIFTWTMMIAGYAKHGNSKEAFTIYERMQMEGVMPDRVTFICVLNACASLGALQKGKQVHADIVKAGIGSYVDLDNTIIDMYAKCRSVDDARQVFDKMAKRNVVSWNAMIAGYARQGHSDDALKLYEQMQGEGMMPDRVTFICVLNACGNLQALGKGQRVHASFIKAGIGPDIVLETTLVHMYVKCGSAKDAHEVFEKMAVRNVVLWNAVITAYAQHGHGEEALKIYEQMQWEKVTPNNVTFICVLTACTSVRALKKGEKVHADIIRAGISPDMILETNLVDMYAKCGSVKDACVVFDKMAKRDVVSWTAMISGYVQHGHGVEALNMYKQMQLEGVKPNKVTFICVLNACASLRALEKGEQVHADIIKAGIVPDINLETTLVDMYAKCGSSQNAYQVFDKMAKRDVVSWNAMIAGYAQQGHGEEALKLYVKMQREGVSPDNVTFICILNASANLGALEKGKQVHADILRAGLSLDVYLGTSLVDMYAKCGSVDNARRVFDIMATRNVVSWNAMITGYAQHGCGREAIQLFEKFLQEDFNPDCITFTSVISACSHVGLVEEGCHYFDSMTQDYSLIPTLEQLGSMVDLLGRSGRLHEAEEFISKAPIEPDASVWGALLGACRIHGDVDVAERVAKCLLKWDAENFLLKQSAD